MLSEHGVARWDGTKFARLSAGDTLELRQRDVKWALHELAGNVVGRLASAFTPPAGMRCIGAAVAAVLMRFEDDGGPHRVQPRRPRWEVVIPELEFEPVEPVVPENDSWAASAAAIDGKRNVADR